MHCMTYRANPNLMVMLRRCIGVCLYQRQVTLHIRGTAGRRQQESTPKSPQMLTRKAQLQNCGHNEAQPDRERSLPPANGIKPE